MGADIYLRSVSRACEARHQGELDAAVKERDALVPEIEELQKAIAQLKRRGEDAKLSLPALEEPLAALEAKRDECQRRVIEADAAMYAEGYFRDSYNDGNMFWQYGLSWWKDFGPLLDDQCHLPIDAAKKFLADLSGRPAPTAESIREKLAKNGMDWSKTDETPEQWRDCFIERRKKFIALLQQSIDMNEPLYCSV